MFNKEFYEEIKNKIKEINKIKSIDERVVQTIALKELVYNKIGDEIDELFSDINLRKNKNEE